MGDIESYIGFSIPAKFPEDDDFCHDYKRYVPRKKAPAGDGRGPADKGRRPPRKRSGRRKESGKHGGGKSDGGSSSN